MLDWKKKELVLETNFKERVRDLKFLHNMSMFALAQKKYVFIYDNQGIELHKLDHHHEPKFLDYLPYHFLLVSASLRGHLKYQDITSGTLISEMNSHKGEPTSLSQNP